MARRGAWGGGMALGAGLIVLAAWLPGYRLEREVAAARREGMWTEWIDIVRDASTVPAAQNAAPLIRKAIALEKTVPKAWDDAAGRFLKGTATPAEAALVRRESLAHPEVAAAWRKDAARPRVDYGRRWQDGGATLFPEFATLKRAARRLAVEARLGRSPRENLVAAARLANLTRQEPVLIAPLVSVALGRIALREAKRQGLAQEVEAALGPPLDVRRAYAAEFAFALDVMRNEATDDWERRMGLREKSPLWYRLAHAGPRRAAETRAVVRDWRAFWRELPRDGTDYAGAARAMRRWLPPINRRMADWSVIYAKLGYDPNDDAGQFALALQKYESERVAARAAATRDR